MDYRIAVCDDSEADTGYIADLLLEWAGTRNFKVAAEKFPSAEAFLFRYAEEKDFDILLLDIEMEGMDGVALAEKIRDTDRDIPIVFITGYPDYMAKGYDVAALHYLMKPIDRGKFFEVMDRAADAAGKRRHPLLLDTGKEKLLVYPEDILYAESQGHYMVLYWKGGEQKLRMTMQEMLQFLGDGFFQCSRSFIAGLRYISRITKKTVILVNGTEIPLGRGMYDELNLALIKYLREN